MIATVFGVLALLMLVDSGLHLARSGWSTGFFVPLGLALVFVLNTVGSLLGWFPLRLTRSRPAASPPPQS
jgi:hypothetical protein